jgi:hypothetical protein
MIDTTVIRAAWQPGSPGPWHPDSPQDLVLRLCDEVDRLREKERTTRQQAIALIEEAQVMMRPQGEWEAELEEVRAELTTLRAALIRWRDADGTMDFPDVDAALMELARGLT